MGIEEDAVAEFAEGAVFELLDVLLGASAVGGDLRDGAGFPWGEGGAGDGEAEIYARLGVTHELRRVELV